MKQIEITVRPDDESGYAELLSLLDADTVLAEERYMFLRRRLETFFVARGHGAFSLDLTDETLMRVASTLSQGREVRDLAVFAFGVARNIALEHLRERQKHVSLEEVPEINQIPDPETTMYELEIAQRIEAMRDAFARLPLDERKLLRQYYSIEEDYWREGVRRKARRELAKRLNISEVTLRKRVSRIRAKLIDD